MKGKGKQKYFVPPPAPLPDGLPPPDQMLAEVRAEQRIPEKRAVPDFSKLNKPRQQADPSGEPSGEPSTVGAFAMTGAAVMDEGMSRDVPAGTQVMVVSADGTGGVVIRSAQDALLTVAKLIEKGVQMTDLPPDAVFSLSATPRSDLVAYGKRPKRVICQFCGSEILTSIVPKRNTLIQSGICMMLCAGGCCCCACAPYCFNDLFTERVHTCPACTRPIAKGQSLFSIGFGYD